MYDTKIQAALVALFVFVPAFLLHMWLSVRSLERAEIWLRALDLLPHFSIQARIEAGPFGRSLTLHDLKVIRDRSPAEGGGRLFLAADSLHLDGIRIIPDAPLAVRTDRMILEGGQYVERRPLQGDIRINFDLLRLNRPDIEALLLFFATLQPFDAPELPASHILLRGLAYHSPERQGHVGMLNLSNRAGLLVVTARRLAAMYPQDDIILHSARTGLSHLAPVQLPAALFSWPLHAFLDIRDEETEEVSADYTYRQIRVEKDGQEDRIRIGRYEGETEYRADPDRYRRRIGLQTVRINPAIFPLIRGQIYRFIWADLSGLWPLGTDYVPQLMRAAELYHEETGADEIRLDIEWEQNVDHRVAEAREEHHIIWQQGYALSHIWHLSEVPKEPDYPAVRAQARVSGLDFALVDNGLINRSLDLMADQERFSREMLAETLLRDEGRLREDYREAVHGFLLRPTLFRLRFVPGTRLYLGSMEQNGLMILMQHFEDADVYYDDSTH